VTLKDERAEGFAVRIAASFLGIILISGSVPAHAQQVAALPNATTPVSNAATVGNDYVIGMQDTLDVDVFQVPDLSRAVTVDSAGMITYPLLGQIHASGMTPNQLATVISADLNRRYVKDPLVTVSVKDAGSQKVTVDGSVTQPGVYQIGPQTTLVQAVALAKGPAELADLHRVALIRNGSEGRTTAIFDLQKIRDGKAVDPLVRANDTIVVDESGTKSFFHDLGNVVPIFSFLHF
jgi:polysaccharide export outer membrane protein